MAANLFEKAIAERNTRIQQGAWPCCYRHGESAPGCCVRKIHRRAGHTFCFLCGNWFSLQDNLAALLNGHNNCSYHIPGAKVTLPTTKTSNAFCWAWECCNAVGREASQFGTNEELCRDGSVYTWGCRRGLHCGIPIAVNNGQGECEKVSGVDDKERDILVRIAKEEEQDAPTRRKTVAKPRPDQWYTVELLSNIVPEMSLNPIRLVAAITGRWPKPYKNGMSHARETADSNGDCLWRRLQRCVLLSGVEAGANENSVKRFCEAVIIGKRMARNHAETQGSVVDVFQCYGSGFDTEGYADTSDDDVLEGAEDDSKVEEEELSSPEPMDGGLFQVEMRDRIAAEMLRRRLSRHADSRDDAALAGVVNQHDFSLHQLLPLGWSRIPKVVQHPGNLVAIWIPGAEEKEVYKPAKPAAMKVAPPSHAQGKSNEKSIMDLEPAETSSSCEDDDDDDDEEEEEKEELTVSVTALFQLFREFL